MKKLRKTYRALGAWNMRNSLFQKRNKGESSVTLFPFNQKEKELHRAEKASMERTVLNALKICSYPILFMVFIVSCRGQNNSNTGNSIWQNKKVKDSVALSIAASELTKQRVVYDPTYFSIPYPNGDVPNGKGVCTDVVIRAYRKLNIDLQQLVHEDMLANFSKYPKIWGLKKTDTNIDHRRVPNLMTFFERQGASLPITNKATDYQPGDVVAWRLGGGLTHIGIVISERSTDGKRHLIVHNIGSGQVKEDVLFAYKIIGHYRWK